MQTDEALSRVRLACLTLLWVRLPFIAIDFNWSPAIAPRVLPFHLAYLGLLLLIFGLTYLTWYRRHWGDITLAFFMLLVLVGTLTSMHNPSPGIHLIALCIMSLVAAIFIPWGMGRQAILNLDCLVSFALHQGAFTGPVGVIAFRWLGLLTVLVLAQLADFQLGSFRQRVNRQMMELEEREHKFRQVFEASFDGIAISTLEDGRFVDSNQAFVEMTGIPPEELRQRSLAGLFKDRLRLAAIVEEIGQGRAVERQEISLSGRDGAALIALLSFAPIDLGGRRCILAFVHDVTELRRIDELLSLSRFSIDHAADLIFWLGRRGEITYANQAACEALGYRFEELVALEIGGLCPVAESVWTQIPARRQVVIETTLRTRDGASLPVRIAASHIHSGEKVLICAPVPQTAGARAVRAVQEAGHADAGLEEFATAASHDLQEPLNTISGYLDVLERRYAGRLDADAVQFIRYSADAAKQLYRMIEDLLAYARVDAHILYRQCECNEALRHALDNLRLAIEESGAVIAHDPLPQLTADTALLTLLFQNLISNAIKFRAAGRPEIRIEVQQNNDGWLFAVRDNGIGIDRKDWERVFAIFQRLHHRSEYPGSGVGLATCRRIVERHGGRIWVESVLGEGAVFFFTMPYARAV